MEAEDKVVSEVHYFSKEISSYKEDLKGGKIFFFYTKLNCLKKIYFHFLLIIELINNINLVKFCKISNSTEAVIYSYHSKEVNKNNWVFY